MAETKMPAPGFANVTVAADQIARQLTTSLHDGVLPVTEGWLVLSFLTRANVEKHQVEALFEALRRRGAYAKFLQLAHPRSGKAIRGWLQSMEVPWDRVHEHYVYDYRDSIDLFAGFVAGMGVALVDLPLMLAKVTKVVIDGRLADEAEKFFQSLRMLIEKDLRTILGEVASHWVAEYDGLVFRLEWFLAGHHLGVTLMNIALFGEAAAKIVAGLPRFIRAVPGHAKSIAELVQRTSARTLKTVEDVVQYIRDVVPALIHAPDLRHSRWLACIATPSEFRALVLGEGFRTVTKYGFELLYVPGKATERGAIILRSGPLAEDFIPEACVLIRRNGRIIGKITHPRSLARAFDGLSDADLDKYLSLLDDTSFPMVPADSDIMRMLVKRAQASADFAERFLTFNPQLMIEDFLLAIRDARNRFLRAPAKPGFDASRFGTFVESAMKPFILQWQARYPLITMYRKTRMRMILASRVPHQPGLMTMTVEQYCRKNTLLAKQIGYQGNNLKEILAADAKTLIGNLELDLFLMDASQTQGLLLDFAAGLSTPHWNKLLLYHALLQEAFPKMRLPLGEMYHLGLGG